MSSNSKPILYGMIISPPVRAVVLTLKALNLDFEFREVNLSAGEHKSPDFLKKNPQHTIPTLEDDGKFIWDSHAIVAYLARKYGKDNDSLYPMDYYRRAVIDQRLHFDNGVLWPCVMKTVGITIGGKATKEQIPELITSVIEQFDMLETFLTNQKYFAGDILTIADFSIVATVTYLLCLATIDGSKHPKLAAWFECMKQLPYYEEACGKGAKTIDEFFQKKLAEL